MTRSFFYCFIEQVFVALKMCVVLRKLHPTDLQKTGSIYKAVRGRVLKITATIGRGNRFGIHCFAPRRMTGSVMTSSRYDEGYKGCVLPM